MANPIKGEVPLEAGGKRYTFVLGTYALAALERRMKMPWPKLFKRAADGDWGIDEILATVHAGLLRHHRQITEEQVADLIDELGIERINDVLSEAIKLMQPEGGGTAGTTEAMIPDNPTKPGNGLGTTSFQTG
jgi:Phage tail tube protein, GTA-gp10